MAQAARITGSLLAGLAIAGLLVAQLVPFEAKTFPLRGGQVPYEATPWLRHVGGPSPSTASWYSGGLTQAAGALPIRFATPLLALGGVAAIGTVALLAFQKRRLAGAAALLGAVASGTGVVLLALGLDRHFRADPDIGTTLDYAAGFYLAFASVVLLLAASVFAFLAVTEDPSRRSHRNLPARPTISVENPQAFNPNQSADARPFKADPERELPGFIVTGGNREFRAESGPKKPLAGPQVTATQKEGAEKADPAQRKAAQRMPETAGAKKQG